MSPPNHNNPTQGCNSLCKGGADRAPQNQSKNRRWARDALDVLAHTTRPPRRVPAAELPSSDPRLRGRAAGRGDALERFALRLVESGMAIPVRKRQGAPGFAMFTVVKKVSPEGPE